MWLLGSTPVEACFTPEQLTDEQRLVARTASEFVTKEVAPALGRLEQKDWGIVRTLLEQAGTLGLLGIDVPEQYGGIDLDKISSIVVGEEMGRIAAFSAAFGAQAGLALTPLLCFGTDEQKQRYLPRLVAGGIVGAYALSESGSGSDALGARAHASRLPDGGFLLNGEKMWITNGGFADLFVVFAKVDGAHFTAFLVERGFGGVSNGAEEHKMGLHGSSTTPLVLQDVKVPPAGLLGEVGRGHKVAFTVLNYGRVKLAATCSGGARDAIGEAARYAAARRQFGKPIGSFGAIRAKLAEMTIREFAVESMLYRTAGMMDAGIAGHPGPHALLDTLEEFALEASILKVAGSEMLDFVVDENVQIHGGNGFVHDYAAERHYRDARVNRIFEGTNEINRMLIPGLLVKRSLKGAFPLTDAARDSGLAGVAPGASSDGLLGRELDVVGRVKQSAIRLIDAAMARFGTSLADEQEIMSALGDMVIDAFAAESSVLRAARMGGGPAVAAAKIVVHDAARRVQDAADTVLAALGPTTPGAPAFRHPSAAGDLLDTIGLRREVADAVVARGGYPFSRA